MSKLNTFLTSFKKSLIQPNYYQDVVKAKFSFSLKYFLFLFLLLSLLTTLAVSIFLVKTVNPYLEKLKTDLPKLFPPELTITIKNGQVSTNVTEPYFVPLNPAAFPPEVSQMLKNQPLQNLLVIDTNTDPSQMQKYQTFALLTKDSVAFIAERNEIRIKSLQEVKDFYLDQKLVETIWQKIIPVFKWIIPVMVIGLILFLPGFTILFRFSYLAVFSLMAWLLSKLYKELNLSYSKALQINLHAITLPTVIIGVFGLFNVPPRIPFFQTIILIIFNLLIFSSLKQPSSPSPSKPS